MNGCGPTRAAITVMMATVLAVGTAAVAEESDPLPVIDGTWRQLAEAPFGSIAAASAWLEDEMLVVDLPSARAATYDLTADVWTELPQGDFGIEQSSAWAWTGSEMLLFDSFGTRENRAFDPSSGTWRTLAKGPIAGPGFAVWADDRVVVASRILEAAIYDPLTDAWTALPPIPGRRFIGLDWTGSDVLAVTAEGGMTQVSTLDSETLTWDEPNVGPLAGDYTDPPVWTGTELLFVSTWHSDPDRAANGTFGPASGTWTEREFDCPWLSSANLWSDGLLANPSAGEAGDTEPGYALDSDTGTCYLLANDDVRADHLSMYTGQPVIRGSAVTLDADGEIILWSGSGDAYLIEPGHDGWVVGDEPLVVLEFESADAFAKV